MAWTKLPAIAQNDVRTACLCCGTPAALFPAEAWIAVGFGYAALTKDGQEIYAEPQGPDDFDESEYLSGAQAEEMAAADPDHDWRISLVGPLSERHYQRHAAGQWVLVQQGEGFA